MKRVIAVLAAVSAVAAGSSVGQAETIYGVTANQIFSFDSLTPGNIISGVAITGLTNGEVPVGIDARPATGELFLLGTLSNLYTINPSTGAATLVAGLNNGGTPPSATPLNGLNFGVDFNPTVDRIRIVSNADQNLRVNPTNAAAIVDGPLAYVVGDVNAAVDPNIIDVAYTNNRPSTGLGTTLYGIDAGLTTLVSFASPNAGTLTTVGRLLPVGQNVNELGGFDISGVTGIAYVSLETVSGESRLYTVNLATGAATEVGQIGGGPIVLGLTVAAIPEPAAMGLALPALAVLARRRR